MAITNHERIGKCLEQVAAGLQPFVERDLKSTYQNQWFAETKKTLSATQVEFLGSAEKPEWDVASLLATLWNQWNDVFRKVLGPVERSLVSELRDVRNKWAHHRTFTTDDSYRALDTIERLLNAVSAPKEAEEIGRHKAELLRKKGSVNGIVIFYRHFDHFNRATICGCAYPYATGSKMRITRKSIIIAAGFGDGSKIARTVRGSAFGLTYENGRKIARMVRGKKSWFCAKMGR